MQAAFLVTKEEGVWALWKGNLANVIRVIPVYGLKCVLMLARGPPNRDNPAKTVSHPTPFPTPPRPAQICVQR